MSVRHTVDGDGKQVLTLYVIERCEREVLRKWRRDRVVQNLRLLVFRNVWAPLSVVALCDIFDT